MLSLRCSTTYHIAHTAHKVSGETLMHSAHRTQTRSETYLHQVRFQIRTVALVHTQVLMAMPVPNIENRLIFSTSRLGRFLMVHSGIGLLVWCAIVTLASHLFKTARMHIKELENHFYRCHVNANASVH